MNYVECSAEKVRWQTEGCTIRVVVWTIAVKRGCSRNVSLFPKLSLVWYNVRFRKMDLAPVETGTVQ